MSGSVVAVIDWRSASALKENARFLESARAADRVRPRDWRSRAGSWRSLVIREDGSCELRRWSVSTAARHLGGRIAGRTAGKAGSGERG